MSQVFNDKKLQKLLGPKRLEMLQVDKALSLIDIKKNSTILDIGSGPGVFTIPACKLTEGKVLGLDLSEKMTEFLKARFQEEGLENGHTFQGGIEDLKDSAFDRVIISHVLHEVPDAQAFVENVAKRMSDHGNLLLIDWKKEAMESGPSLEYRISQDEAGKLFQQKFEEVSRQDWGPMFYLMIFKRR